MANESITSNKHEQHHNKGDKTMWIAVLIGKAGTPTLGKAVSAANHEDAFTAAIEILNSAGVNTSDDEADIRETLAGESEYTADLCGDSVTVAIGRLG